VGNKLHAHDQNMAEHLAVIENLLANKATEAANAMGRHIDRGAATAVEALGLNNANGGDAKRDQT
jgi:DNA-binding GntR family transcriptional regulator